MALAAALLGAVTVAVAAAGVEPASSLRHLYLVPAILAGLRGGAAPACLVGVLAGLLQAPVVLPAFERLGLTAATLDGLLSVAAPLGVGSVVGRLVDQSRRRGAQLDALHDLQALLIQDEPVADGLGAVARRLRVLLGADRVGLVVTLEGQPPIVASDPAGTSLHPRSAARRALDEHRALAIADLGSDPRFGPVCPAPTPLRGLLLPLPTPAGILGVLAVERAGDLPAATLAAAREVALHLALGIENARLAARQRRFAEELEQKVASATRRLQELDRAKSEFLSTVAHELRTPLTALQGFSELLLARAVPAERARTLLGHMHREARRLGRIVAELLDLSRIESGAGLELRREPVALGRVVEPNLDLFAVDHPRHRFGWEPEATLPAVHADPDAVDRMVKNLLSNAVKYSPRGGRIRVTAGWAPDRPGLVELAVEDEGVGIAPEALPRVFDKYVRIAHPDTTAARGLGLGLSLVRALVEAHGGEVEARSRPGRGSRFRLLLPPASPQM
jgi:signal transduction histidine kinase